MKVVSDLICSGAKEKKGALPVAWGDKHPPSLFASAGAFNVD
jgi:hypothetical protein